MRKEFKFVTLTLCLFLATACQTTNPTSSSEDEGVPVYEGMTVSSTGGKSSYSGSSLKKFSKTTTHHTGHGTKPEKTLKELVEIDFEPVEKIESYVEINKPFIIEVHISNPLQFEIQSFTLNGEKYASYMFEKGSTMECVLLQTTAPSQPGYYEYTIDAIKYIDGTVIKDVDMRRGDKTVKVGVSHVSPPAATITSSNIDVTSASFSLKVSDLERLCGDRNPKLYLSDGKTILYSSDLIIGSNDIQFENLTASTIYEFGVACVYDFVDERQMHSEWILTKEFETKNAIEISNIKTTKTDISFEIVKKNDTVIIDKVSLYDTTTDSLIEELEGSKRSFESVLSNHSYDIYVDYTYISDSKSLNDWNVCENVFTKEKIKPVVTIGNIVSEYESVTGNISITDVDNIASLENVSIYKGDTLVDTNPLNQISFTSLDNGTEYEIRVSYSYDLNDGLGIITDEVKKTFTTLYSEPEYVEVNSLADFADYCSAHGKASVDQTGYSRYYAPYVFKCTFTVATMEYTYGQLYSGLSYSSVGCGLILEDINGQYIFTSCISFDTSYFVWNPEKNYYNQCDYPEEPTGFDTDSRTFNIDKGSKITLYVIESKNSFGNFSGKYSGHYCWCVYAD